VHFYRPLTLARSHGRRSVVACAYAAAGRYP
jgi:hypothetical protein